MGGPGPDWSALPYRQIYITKKKLQDNLEVMPILLIIKRQHGGLYISFLFSQIGHSSCAVITDIFSLSTLLPSHVTLDILHNLPFVYIMLILVLVNDRK